MTEKGKEMGVGGGGGAEIERERESFVCLDVVLGR